MQRKFLLLKIYCWFKAIMSIKIIWMQIQIMQLKLYGECLEALKINPELKFFRWRKI